VGKVAATGHAKKPVQAGAPKPASPKAKAEQTAKAAPKSLGDTFAAAASQHPSLLGVPSKAVDAADGIASTFPIDDLAAIETHGRWASAFRLDGGSVRLMWTSVRRSQDAAGKPSCEITFFTHGNAVKAFAKRLKAAGAKPNVKMKFFKSDLVEGSDGKPRLAQTKGTWSPTGGKGLRLEKPGEYRVEMYTNNPEALKGAVRITLEGDDAKATKTLGPLLQKLGMQSLFAPSTPQALERFKMMRMLWQLAPSAIDGIRYRGLADFEKAELDAALTDSGIGSSSKAAKALLKADLTDKAVAKRLKLALLLLDSSPPRFIEWASSDSRSKHGILPDMDEWETDYGLEEALEDVGVKTDGKTFNAAVKHKLDPVVARKLMRFGLLAERKKSAATALIARDVESVELPKLREALNAAGISDKRIDATHFEEVYPGYFTVIDPALPQQLYKAGARYLYSTAPSPERVWQILTGGQKSSFTRFQEGLLIEGKSSDEDFNSGGAFSVFTRLVTKSAIDSAKKKNSYDRKTFEDWGGDRPYKVILDRSILGRLDWYGYNEDEYGSTKKLTAQNRGAAIIKDINKSYSTTNEVMFPVGNSPSYINYVVCETKPQRDAMIEYLEGQGLTEVNGKPIAEFVRIETKFFQLPGDKS